MKTKSMLLLQVLTLCWILLSCATSEKLLTTSRFPVFTTFEILEGTTIVPPGKIVCVAGVITKCERAQNVVVLDRKFKCVLDAYEGDALSNLMKSFSENVGEATALRGVLIPSNESTYAYKLQPAAPAIEEDDEAAKKLTAEKGRRPGLKIKAFYGGIGHFDPIWETRTKPVAP